jgi:hypothetical protein
MYHGRTRVVGSVNDVRFPFAQARQLVGLQQTEHQTLHRLGQLKNIAKGQAPIRHP